MRMSTWGPWSGTRPRRSDARWLAEQVAQGQPEALAELYRSEAGPVYRYALALCGNAAWAADATQEAFIAFAQKPGDYDPTRATPGAYLAGGGCPTPLAQPRSQRLGVPWPETSGPGGPGGPGGVGDGFGDRPSDAARERLGPAGWEQRHPESLAVGAQTTAELWAALRQLPCAFREAVVLVDLQERPYAEAARIAGIELNTLRTRVHRGRARWAGRVANPGQLERQKQPAG
jgi:RNA polymerase sigma-70 factor, ECF subfamily